MGLASYEAEFVSASSETFNDRGTTNVEVQTIKGLGNEEDGLLFNADVAFFREGFSPTSKRSFRLRTSARTAATSNWAS